MNGRVFIAWSLLLALLIAGQTRVGPAIASEVVEAALCAAFIILLVKRGRWVATPLDAPIAIWTLLGVPWCLLGIARQSACPSPYDNILYGGTADGPFFVLGAQLAMCAAYYLASWTDGDALESAIEACAIMVLPLCALDALRHMSPDGRIEAGFTNANLLAAFLTLLLPISIARFIRGGMFRAGNMPRALLIAGLTWALIETHSRGAQAGLAAALFVIALAWANAPGSRNRKRSLAIVSCAALAAVVGGSAMVLTHRGFGDTLDHKISDGQRQVAWRAATELLRSHPLTGVGLGAFPASMLRLGLKEPNPVTATGLPGIPAVHVHAHNLVLQAAAERGLAGLALLAIGGWIVALAVVRAVRYEPAAASAVGAAAAICAWAVNGLTDYTAWFPAVAIMLGIQIGRLFQDSVAPTPATFGLSWWHVRDLRQRVRVRNGHNVEVNR